MAETMTQTSAPDGTMALLGHPSNNQRIVKVNGNWLYVHSGEIVDPEDFRAGWDVLADIERERLLAAAQHLTEEVLSQRLVNICDLTAVKGSGPCLRRSVAIRWEDGFADLVCEHHAQTARDRGALVIFPKRHDGSGKPLGES